MTLAHQHQHAGDETTGNLRLAFFLNLGFTVVELIGGFWTNSIAIQADALHDLGDSLSLGLSWYLQNLSQKEADDTFTYGYRRFSLLGAFINAVVLIGGSLWLLVNAIPRLLEPQPADAPAMIGFAVLGIAVNGFAAYRLYRDQALNARVVGWHLLEDVLGWAAVLLVSIVLLFTEAYILDAILSILITAYILFNVIGNLRQTARLFLQAAPQDIDLGSIVARIRELEPVEDVHHTHLWSLDGEHHVLSTHVVVRPETSKEAASDIKREIAAGIKNERFAHLTIEIEYGEEDCRLERS